MDRIAACFDKAKREGRAAFIAYVCAGDPDFETSMEVCRTLVRSGIDLLELGMPFSDPLADGLTNQLASDRALAAGIHREQVFQLVRELRKETEIPIIFYTYYNLVLADGDEGFAKRCQDAGVDGLLTLDLPPEYAGDLLPVCEKHGVKNVFIVAPTTPPDRVETIAKSASGFIYYVSREGVTGERDSLADNIGESVAEIRKHTNLPVAVGFGISKREHVAEVAKVADGVVVGSALVNCIARNQGDAPAILAALKAKADDLVAGTARS